MGTIAVTMKQRAGERASRLKALGVETLRDNSGMVRDVVDLVIDRYMEGATFADALGAVQDELAARAIARYGDAIRAALRRAGFDVPDGTELDAATIADLVREKTGLQFASLDSASVIEYVDKEMAARVTALTGVPVSSVYNAQTLMQEMKDGVREAIKNGTAERLLTQGMSVAARRVATWRRYGYTTKESRRKAMQRLYAKRYAETHRQVWE